MNYFSGDIVTMECVEKLIKMDMIHPLTSIKLKEKDIIPLQRVCYLLVNLQTKVELTILVFVLIL